MEAVADGELLSIVQTGELASLRAELRGAREDLAGIKAELGPHLGFARFLGWLPVVGGDVAAAPDASGGASCAKQNGTGDSSLCAE